ncbi:hypothetical protein OQH60_07770 [Campylobacter sp. MIT 21-1685]|uniref:hypothetical protein n=1 Tax=unclassified Campylobacter TaxID=2593542 RepID=UPI00224B2BA0|nr:MULTISPECIES: hypothetical protein [unclassified Campylobacter]MCX2683756.1 hypothetical protein [Campylobacter sp. MIT 21-1684]MCX2752040.1 hypothetical protein [Campylobacter sp. MIT 21-1682]MCX2808234.1 hypothetical protein [Campylobacter sp. MIT 21-1685]
MNITLSKEAQNLLHLAQENTKQPLDEIITKVLANYLEDLEDYKSAQEAEKRLLSGTSFIGIEDLAKKAKLNASEI